MGLVGFLIKVMRFGNMGVNENKYNFLFLTIKITIFLHMFISKY